MSLDVYYKSSCDNSKFNNLSIAIPTNRLAIHTNILPLFKKLQIINFMSKFIYSKCILMWTQSTLPFTFRAVFFARFFVSLLKGSSSLELAKRETQFFYYKTFSCPIHHCKRRDVPNAIVLKYL